MDNNLRDLIKKQRKDIYERGNYSRMNFVELKRLDKYCDGYIFGESCIRFTGALKGGVPIFSFRSNKVSLHRLLYHNYTGSICRSDIITLECPNKICINVLHIHIRDREKYE